MIIDTFDQRITFDEGEEVDVTDLHYLLDILEHFNPNKDSVSDEALAALRAKLQGAFTEAEQDANRYNGGIIIDPENEPTPVPYSRSVDVQSLSDPNQSYTVTHAGYSVDHVENPGVYSCTCPDFVHRKAESGDVCKHIVRAQGLI